MPSVKENVNIFSAQALASGGGPTTSGFVDLRDDYGGIWHVTVTMLAQKASKGVQVQAEVAPTQTAGDETPFDCRHIANELAAAVTKFTIRIPPEAQFTRLVVQHTDENAQVDAIFARLAQV